MTFASRNLGLDCLRSLAISFVLISHLAKALEVLGVLGVELFFVLSGFLIGSGLYRQVKLAGEFTPRDLGRFWQRRWARTLPNYYLFLGVHAAWWLILGQRLGWSEASYGLFLQNLAWPVGGFYQVSWSLGVEEWFYLLFPAMILLLMLTGKAPRTVFIGCTALFAVTPAIWRASMANAVDWNVAVRMVVAPRLDAMMFGVAAAIWHQERPTHWRIFGKYGGFVGMITLAGLSVVLFRAFPDHTTGAVPVWLLFSLLPAAIAMTLPFWEGLTSLPGRNEIENLSRISYSVYLSHIPIIFLCYALMEHGQGWQAKLCAKVIGILLTLFVSWVIYWRFERPLMECLSPVRETARS